MSRKNVIQIIVISLITILSAFIVISCNNSNQTSSPGGGAVVQSDSIILGEIKGIHEQKTGYPWEIDVLVQSSESVGSLPNPTKDVIGKIITAKTDEEMRSFSVGQIISARVKYVGDVPKPGISLYIVNVETH